VTSEFPWCDEVCSRTFGFRVVLLWSFWSMLFLVLALRAARRAARQQREGAAAAGREDGAKKYVTTYTPFPMTSEA
jgi:hypothetical protein